MALLVGFVVMLGVGQLFVQSKRSASLQEEMARLQESGRFALDLLRRDIQRAGYLGCSHASTLQEHITSSGSYVDDLGSFVFGYEGRASGWSPVLPVDLDDPATTVDDPAPGSDVITLRFAEGEGLRMTQPKLSYHFKVHNLLVESGACAGGADRYSGLCSGDQAVVSDCAKARIFTIGDLHLSGAELLIYHVLPAWGDPTDPDPGNHFSQAYSYIFKGVTISYFVRAGADNGSVPSLYRKIGSEAAEELIEGVENMQILYGLDSDEDGIPNQFFSADAISDVREVVAVRIALLLRSIEERLDRAPEAKSYTLLTSTITSPSDRHLRKVFHTTIHLRNGRT